MVHGVEWAGVLEVGGGPGRAVGRYLVTRECLTNSRSAGLGCASWLLEEDQGYSRARGNGGGYCHCQGTPHVLLLFYHCA